MGEMLLVRAPNVLYITVCIYFGTYQPMGMARTPKENPREYNYKRKCKIHIA